MSAVPNLLSIFRICLVPVFVFVYFSDTNDIKIYPTLIYAIAALSDFLDGYLARKYQVSSKLGMILDPLGDKMITTAVMVCISIDAIIPIWAVVVTVIKEILMGVGGYLMHKLANADIPPSNLLGKAATIVFFVVCVTLMLYRDISRNAATALISFAILLTIFSFLSYLSNYIKVMKSRGRTVI